MDYKVWECLVCGFTYDEAKGWPDDGIEPGTRWEDIPEDWVCPDCGVGKADFEMVAISTAAAEPASEAKPAATPSTTPTPATTPITPEAAPAIDWSLKPIIILGTGLAGYNLAREFRRQDTATPLIMVTADDGRFYSKPTISTGFAKGKQPDQLATATAADMAAELNADIRIFTRVTAIDASGHGISLGDEVVEYGKLVLATGARCVEPPLKGNGLSRVYNINDLLDYTRFRTALVGRKKILIIGAGLIGSEYANDLVQSGFEIEVVEPMSGPLATLLPPQAGAAVQNVLEQAGVKYHLGTVVDSVDIADRPGSGVRATLANGQVVEADVVLSAIGVRPDLQLAQAAGLAINRGIVTSRSLQTSAADVYALGDCAEVDGHLLYFVAPLMESARVLSKVLSGEQAEVNYGVMPVLVKTTLCPVVVAPPPVNVEGEWQVSEEGVNVSAKFISPNGELLGFALTGDATKEKDALSASTRAIMD